MVAGRNECRTLHSLRLASPRHNFGSSGDSTSTNEWGGGRWDLYGEMGSWLWVPLCLGFPVSAASHRSWDSAGLRLHHPPARSTSTTPQAVASPLPPNWDDATTPTTHRVPGATDFACIPSTIAGAVTYAGKNISVLGVSAGGSGGFAISSGTLTLSSTTEPSTIAKLGLSGGTITGAGNLALTGQTTWSNGKIEPHRDHHFERGADRHRE